MLPVRKRVELETQQMAYFQVRTAVCGEAVSRVGFEFIPVGQATGHVYNGVWGIVVEGLEPSSEIPPDRTPMRI